MAYGRAPPRRRRTDAASALMIGRLYARDDTGGLAEVLGVQMEPEYRPCLALLRFVKFPASRLVRA
jgi:hypothetical protein